MEYTLQLLVCLPFLRQVHLEWEVARLRDMRTRVCVCSSVVRDLSTFNTQHAITASILLPSSASTEPYHGQRIQSLDLFRNDGELQLRHVEQVPPRRVLWQR